MGGTTGRKGRYGHYVMRCGSCARGLSRGKDVTCFWNQTIVHFGNACCEAYVNRRSNKAKEINRYECNPELQQ